MTLKKNDKYRGTLYALTAGFIATLLGLPSHAALIIPNTPLQSASPIPPNIMFILDDSGSMAWDFMPGASSSTEVPAVSPVPIQLKASARNTLYYNPAIDYKTWIQATGSRATGGTTYDLAYSSDSQASGSTINLGDKPQTFYVLKTATSDPALTGSYWRYQILTDGTIVRSEYTATTSQPLNSLTSQTGLTATPGNWSRLTVTVPANADQLVVTISGGSGGDPDLYVRFNNAPATNAYDCRERGGGNTHTCTIDAPSNGTYHIGVYNNAGGRNPTAFTGLSLSAVYTTSLGCSTETGWTGCTQALPTTTRDTVALEKANFATWYSYHRTRVKTAKAAAGESFASLTQTSYRVGFTTIWDRDTHYIPVGSNNGLFTNVPASSGNAGSTNRTDWFTALYAAGANNGTPLQSALKRVGQYYSDGVSGYTGSTGPYGPASTNQLACRQNYSILTTDGYWNNGTEDMGDADSTQGDLITKPGTTAQRYYTPSAPYQDGRSNTLADVAMYYWKKDLMPNLDNIVPASDANPAFWQHMVTFGISIGLQGTLSQKTVKEVKDASANGFTWPDPTDNEDNERIDDLLHAAVNGHGTFAAASNPTELANALKSALEEIAGRENSGSNVSLTSTSVQTDTRAFVAKYKSSEWWGDLEAYPVTSSGVGTPATWKASTTVPATERNNVYTKGASNGATVATFPTSTQEATLTSAVGAYLKGNRAGEGTTYRRRTHLLGDIVNSSPTYVREVVGTSVVETVYIGSNDGMMHAFNASNGAELFTYVPNLLDMTALKGLSAKDNFVHRYFVDGPIVVSNRRQTPDKNYLVGALGRGGKGIYGLDVTTPSTFSSTGRAWEYNGGNDTDDVADMGLVISKPLIAKLNTGETAAIVANGINSTNEHAVLFIVDLATGAKIRKIDTYRSSVATDGVNNGLSAPTGVDTDGNGTVDYVYAGDLRGNVWKFNLSATTSSGWGVAYSGAPLFTAKDASNNAQPITGGVTVSYNPYTFEPWVFFGTGRYLISADKDDKTVQTWYGVVDGAAITDGRTSLKGRSIVVGGTINGRPVRAFEKAVLGDMANKKGWYVDLLTPPTGSATSGTADGERMVGNQVVVGGTVLIASSIIPQSSDCDVSGKGFVNAIDMFTGGAVTSPFFDANGDGSLNYTTTTNGQTTQGDSLGHNNEQIAIGSIDLGVGMPTDPSVLDNLVIVGGSKGTTGSVKIAKLISDGRISWREILKD